MARIRATKCPGHGCRIRCDGGRVPVHLTGVDYGGGDFSAGSKMARGRSWVATGAELHGGVFPVDHREAWAEYPASDGGDGEQVPAGSKMTDIAIIGAGAWGTALSMVAARKGGHRVRLWA